MVKVIKFSGHSDDIFECTVTPENGRAYDDEFYPSQSSYVLVRDMATPEDASDELIVRGQYGDGPSGGWEISVSPTDKSAENRPTPPIGWELSFTQSDAEYSPCLVLRVPDTVEIAQLDSKGLTVPRTKEEETTVLSSLRNENERLKAVLRKISSELSGVNVVTDKIRRLITGP